MMVMDSQSDFFESLSEPEFTASYPTIEVDNFDDDENNPLWALPAWEWRQHLSCIKFNSINWIIMNTKNIEVEE